MKQFSQDASAEYGRYLRGEITLSEYSRSTTTNDVPVDGTNPQKPMSVYTQECDQCGAKADDTWPSWQCCSHPYGSCDGKMVPLKRLTPESIALARESLAMLLELHESGNLEKYGFPSSPERLRLLVEHVAQEATNVLQDELETLSVETHSAKTGIKKVMGFVAAGKQLRLAINLPWRERMFSRPKTTRKLKPKDPVTEPEE